MDVNELGQMTPEQALEHWYFRSKFAMLDRTLNELQLLRTPSIVADFGCGIGLFLNYLTTSRFAGNCDFFGIDNAYESVQPALNCDTPIFPSFPENKKCDLVLMMDVLEHIENDHDILEFISTKINNGGYGYISVPAFQWLWSSHDVFLHHYRRYTLSSLNKLIASVRGLELVRSHYYYASILPPVALLRRLQSNQSTPHSSDLKRSSALINSLLKTILKTETTVAAYNKIAGLSVVAVFQKK